MARKLGNVIIGTIMLAFIISIFNGFFHSADLSEGVSSGRVANALSGIDGQIGQDDLNFQSELTTKTDSTSVFSQTDTTSDIEERGSDASGILNILSKNIIVKFFQELSRHITGINLLLGFLVSLIGVTISILLLRFFWGESKI